MPAVGWSLSVPAGGTASPDLKPYDRFAGGGGGVKIRASVPVAAAGLVSQTTYIGSELIEQSTPVGVERSVGSGPDNFTRATGGIGGPGDPVNITYRNTGVAAHVVSGFMDIENT